MARITGPRKVYRYTDEFKLKAVKLTEIEGIQVQQVAKYQAGQSQSGTCGAE